MTRARELSKLINASSFSVDSDFNVGIGSTQPTEKLDVDGVVVATAFSGDGGSLSHSGGTGGKGIVIIRYPT